MSGIEEKDYDRVREKMAEYNLPPETPKQEMWPVVQAAWRRQAAKKLRLRRQTYWLTWVTAAAAVLVLGVVIGRWTTIKQEDHSLAAVPRSTSSPDADLPMAYVLAASNHFMQAETLFLRFKTEPNDYEVNVLARDLLMTTRLLLDSRIGEDPAVRELLMDIELLFSQIAQLETGPDIVEREFITEGLHGNSILPRLRRFIPTGPTAAGA